MNWKFGNKAAKRSQLEVLRNDEVLVALDYWSYRLKPRVKEIFSEHRRASIANDGCPSMYLTCLSDSIAAGEDAGFNLGGYTDSISVQFVDLPVAHRRNVTVENGETVLRERGARLVFSMHIDGGVSISIYPPRSEVSSPLQEFYLVGQHKDAKSVTLSRIKKLFKLFAQTQSGCRLFSPRKQSVAVLRTLAGKDKDIREGRTLWKKLRSYCEPVISIVGFALSLYGAAL